MGGEVALATYPPNHSNPRAYEKPSQIPGNLTFTVGGSWEPQDWYYAQTKAGRWTIAFSLDRVYTGTVSLTVSSSMQQSSPPTVALNGVAAAGALPTNNDSTIARQADRSGFPRVAVLTFPASALKLGANALTLTRGAGTPAGNGLGWDTLLMEVDEASVPAPARLSGELVSAAGPPLARVFTVRITNVGRGPANDIRIDGFILTPAGGQPQRPRVIGRDPNRSPVPFAASLAPGGSATGQVTANVANASRFNVAIPFSANGGRVLGTILIQNAG
jgi:rhamnogalacturonan endolyase